MKVKKTSLEIKESILRELKKSPKTITEISEAISSNWLTTEKFLKELREEKKVKELVSTEKKKIYQLITGDTYFNLPITEDEGQKFRALFRLILDEYKKKNKTPSKTELSKCAVEVINNPEAGLSNLPVIWYLYGMIPIVVADPYKSYEEEVKLENKIQIIKTIQNYRDDNDFKDKRQIDIEQHKEYNKELYTLADDFLDEINQIPFNKEKVLKILNKFFIICPIDNEFPEVFEFTDRFVSTVNKLSLMNNLKEHKKEISLTFNALWKYIATYEVYKSLVSQKRFKDNSVILEFYIGNLLEARRLCFKESFLELESAYLENLKDIKEDSPSANVRKMRKIMEDWTGED